MTKRNPPSEPLKKSTFNIHEAKTNLSKLVERVEAGDEIVIARAGKPAVRMVPLAPKRKIKFGVLKSEKMWIADDFDAPLSDDVLALFEGR